MNEEFEAAREKLGLDEKTFYDMYNFVMVDNCLREAHEMLLAGRLSAEQYRDAHLALTNPEGHPVVGESIRREKAKLQDLANQNDCTVEKWISGRRVRMVPERPAK